MLRYTPLSSALYVRHRKQLTALLPPNSLAVLLSNDRLPTNADGVMNFQQNSQLFYLSGIAQEESILLLFPDAKEPAWREIVFTRAADPLRLIWEGRVLTRDEVRHQSGVQSVYDLDAFEGIFFQLMVQADHVYLETNEHYRAQILTETRTARFIKECQAKHPLHNYRRLAPLLARLRAIKSPEEIQQLRKACRITEKGFRQVLAFVRPDIKEYEIEAQYAQAFLSRGSRGFAYTPIIASGKNACVLHYVHNSAVCRDGDLILMDVGAEYGNYFADMTRCVPANGQFTPRQRAIYEAVLRVMRTAMTLLKPGTRISEYQQAVGQLVEKELCDLKLLTPQDIKNQNPAEPAYKKYFMHNTSHHLGLDVHDVPSLHQKVEEGMVFTVEPGIYVPDESIGVRLENDIVITKNGYDDLMADIPLEVEEIESLMQKKGRP